MGDNKSILMNIDEISIAVAGSNVFKRNSPEVVTQRGEDRRIRVFDFKEGEKSIKSYNGEVQVQPIGDNKCPLFRLLGS